MFNPAVSSASVSGEMLLAYNRSKAAVKRKITCDLRRISNGSNDNVADNLKMIKSYLVAVNSYDDRINEVICDGISGEQLEDLHVNEWDSQADYTLDT